MTLLKTSLLNGIAVVIKLLTLLGINKVLAIYVGPAGYAALGQFQNAVQMITTFATGAISTGVTKYTAEYEGDEAKQRKVWSTAGGIVVCCSIVAAVIIALANRVLADWFLKDESYGGVFLWFSATLLLFTLNALLLAILNGKKEISRYVMANIGGSLFALLTTVVMTALFGLYGALVALAVYQSIAFFITLLLCIRAPWFSFTHLFGGVDSAVALNLGKFTLMAVVSALCVPLSQIMVRNHLGETHGWEIAGYWEASWRLSAAYLMFLTTTISVYFLPRFSEIRDASVLRQEILQGYKVIVPVAILIGVMMYVLRDFIIHVLFTGEFIAMRELFFWQIIGDTLKVVSWVLAYVMTARAFWKPYILGEVLSSALFYGLVLVFDKYGAVGATMAHALNYLFYLVFVYVVLKVKKALP
ncbi:MULTISPECIES: O-antigen translocase [unclassified Pseudomonas]|uniref:O-antigen translocase n=1 Tax=unclassified Pseudomonas TaxID=196821 RepID=UPI0024492DDA|nr:MULTISPECIES: O-antigen translocase [unclassified Pseudomonas]MDH0304894.1 O-antigen translocase [Pseudomonas sp. GD04091]MDH1988266.1 O-antigen translocase [Pseudomonas sp. GD03689]